MLHLAVIGNNNSLQPKLLYYLNGVHFSHAKTEDVRSKLKFSRSLIVCAVSAPSEGTAFIVQKNDTDVCCHLERGRKEDVSTVPNYPLHLTIGFNSSGSDEEKITNRTGSSFFNEFSLNQYQSNKNSSCSTIENVPSGEAKRYLNCDFRLRKKRNFQSTRKRSKEIEPKTLRPPVDDRTVLCNAQKICCENVPFNKKKDKKKKKEKKKYQEKNKASINMNTFNLNCNEKKLFFRLKSESYRNKVKCKKCKSCKRHLDRVKLDDDLDLDKRIEKLVRNVALENRRKENSEELTQSNNVKEPLEKKPYKGVESVSFFEHIRKAFSNSKKFFKRKLKSDSVEKPQSKETDSDKEARIRCYDILKTMRKVSRVRRNLPPRLRQPIYRHHRKRHFLHLRKRRFPKMTTETSRAVRKVKLRPFHVLGFFSQHGKPHKEKKVEVTDKTSTTNSLTDVDINSILNEVFPTTEIIFTTVTLEGIVAPKNLPQHTLERPFLKENFKILDYNPMIPKEAPDRSEELKMRQAWRTYIKRTIPHFKHFCERKKRGCGKCSKPHRCWRTAPLLCLPYIKKGQDDQLRFLIKLLESMIGKPFPPKIDIFDKIKYRPNVRAQFNECEDSTEGKIFGACTESTTCAPSTTESTPSTTEISLPSCPTTCPPPFPLTHPPTCSPTAPPCPTSTPAPNDICSTTTKTRAVKSMSLVLSKQFNENAVPPITFPVIDEHFTPSFCARRFSQYFSPSVKDPTSNTPTSINTAAFDDSTLSYGTDNEVYFRQPNLFQRRLFRPALDDSFDFSEKLLLPGWRNKGQCLKLPDHDLSELESLLDLPEIQKPILRKELYKTMRSRKHFPYGTDSYYIQRSRVKPKSFDKLLMKEAFRYEDDFPVEERLSNDDFGIPRKFLKTHGKHIPNEDFVYDFDDSYDPENIKDLLLGLDKIKFNRRRMKGIKKRGTYRRHKRGDDYYFSPEKLESYDDYEGPNYSDEHPGSLVEGDSERQTPPTFDTFFSELAKAVSESATTPSTEEEIRKYFATNGTIAPPITEPFLQSLSDKKSVENTTKPLDSMIFKSKGTNPTLEKPQNSLNATDFGSKLSEQPKTTDRSTTTEKPRSEMKSQNESNSHINSTTAADYPLYAISTTESDLEFQDDEMAYPDNTTDEKGRKGGKKTSFFPSKSKTTKKSETESVPAECSRLKFRDDKGLESNQDLDSAEDGQMPTTLKMAVIAKGAKRTTSKPSPKVYTKVYPDSLVKESDLNETMFSVKSTTSVTSERPIPAAALNKTVDLKLQMLAVCEGYLEVIKMIRAQNQTAGKDLDLRLARYCENIISQNFNSQSEKPKKQEWNDSQSLSGADKADDSIEDEQELSKRENLNPEANEPITEADSEEWSENSRNMNSAETTTKEVKTVDQTMRPGLSKKRKRKKNRKPKEQDDAENGENFKKRGVTDDQIKMIQLLRKRKKELLSWLLNRPNKSKFGGIQENEYFDDQNALDQIPDEYSGPIKLRKNLEETKKNPLIGDSEFPVYAKGFGYDKGGEVREVDIIWRKFNEKTHEKKIFKNMSVLALLLTTTGVPKLNQEDLKLVGSNVVDNEEMSEVQQKNEERVGVILEPTETTLRNFSNNDTITTPLTTVATTTTTATGTATPPVPATAASPAMAPMPVIAKGATSTKITVALVPGVTIPTTATAPIAPKTNETNTKTDNKTAAKTGTMTTKKPAGNNTKLIFTKPDSKTIVGRPLGANKTHSNATRKSHRFGTAKDIFQEYSIEFLDYAVYILPIMFTILFLFCCLCCAVHISTAWKKRKKMKKKKKKKKLSSEELSDSSHSSDSESDKQRSKRKGLKNYLKGKNDKKFWKVLKKNETKPDEEKKEEKKKTFLKFLKGKKEEEEGPSYSSPSYSPPFHPIESPRASNGEEKERKWSDDQQKEKSETNSEAAERRELISLLEELKKIETEHVEEKKDVKSVQVQYMMQEDENPVFERLDLGYPYEKNVFGLPKGYSFCSKQIPYRRTNPNAVDDCELYENVNELTELLPCKCGYYSNDYCDFRINKKGRCERFVKIFRDSGINRTQPFVDKNCRENEKGSFIFNKYRSISTDDGEDLLGVTQRNVGTEVRFMENSSPIPLRPKKNADFVEEMENLKRQLNKKKNVRLKDHGVLCRL